MRILIIAPFLPYPDVGHAGGVVLWRMIEGLADRHELSLISLVKDAEEQRQCERLKDCCVSVRTVLHARASTASDFKLRVAPRASSLLFSQLPYSVWRLRSREMTTVITQALRDTQFDVVQIEFTSMGQYVYALGGHPCTILRKHDLAFVHYERRVRTTDIFWRKLYHYIQWRRMHSYELSICPQFHKVIVPSKQARAELLAQLPGLDISVVPFGITLSSAPGSVEPANNKRILFVGAMGRPLNVEAVGYFCQYIWPRILKQEPDAEFWVIGSNPPPHLRRLADMYTGIKVTGFVDDLTPVYEQASIFVAPVWVGGGVVTKILDAMAMHKAVVTTSIGNEGIGATPERDLLIADEPDEFAKQVVGLLRDPLRRQRIGQSGGRFVAEMFGWQGIIDHLENIYDEMVNVGSRQP